MIHGVADFVTRCYFRPSLNISRPRETTRRRSRRKKCRRDISKGWHELISWAAGPNQLLPDSFLRRCCAVSRPPAVSPSFLRGGGTTRWRVYIQFSYFSYFFAFTTVPSLSLVAYTFLVRWGACWGNDGKWEKKKRNGEKQQHNTRNLSPLMPTFLSSCYLHFFILSL